MNFWNLHNFNIGLGHFLENMNLALECKEIPQMRSLDIDVSGKLSYS